MAAILLGYRLDNRKTGAFKEKTKPVSRKKASKRDGTDSSSGINRLKDEIIKPARNRIYGFFLQVGSGYYSLFAKIIGSERCRRRDEKRKLQMEGVLSEFDSESYSYQTNARHALLVMAGIMILGFTGIYSLENQAWHHKNGVKQLERPDYGMSPQIYDIKVEDKLGNKQDIQILLESRKYTEEEIEKLFLEYYQLLSERWKASNPDFSHITENLDFSPIEGWELIALSIYTSDFEIIDQNGSIDTSKALEQGSELLIYVSMQYEEYQKDFEIPVKVFRKEIIGLAGLEDYLNQAEAGNRENAIFALPGEYGEQKLTFTLEEEDIPIGGLFLLVITLVCLMIYIPENRRKEAFQRRNEQLVSDYPEMISRFLILLRAGLPIKGVFQKLVNDYLRHEKKNGEVHYVYEEMHRALKNMENGGGEEQNYYLFGQRCALTSYVKFANLLQQNLRKGSRSIIAVLEEERILAMEEYQRQIRMKGELAGTRLMFPMILLFALVMAIILVPSIVTSQF